MLIFFCRSYSIKLQKMVIKFGVKSSFILQSKINSSQKAINLEKVAIKNLFVKGSSMATFLTDA